MAIAPLSLPGYAAPQSLDFSSLANLGQVYKQASAERGLRDAFANGVPTDAAGLSQLSSQVGAYNPQLGLSLAQLGVNAEQRQQEQARQSRLDERQLSRDAQADKQWAASYDLQKRAAARADEGPVEKAAQRLKLLQSQGIDPGSPEGRGYLLTGEWSGPGAGGLSLNPVYGIGPDGKPAMVQVSKSGQAVQTKLPEGFQISKDPIRVDTATGTQLLDPQTRQPIGYIPKNLAAAERDKAVGDATGAAEVALPTVISNSQQILKTLDLVQQHPGKEYSLGMYSKLPTIPGTRQADFRAAADQLQGQTFLQAFQSLKGGGAITDIEGKKGENAIARLSQAQTADAYDAAINDLRDVVKGGMARAAAKARGAGSPTQGITQEQYNALPSGTPFTAPDGSQRVKP